MIERVAHLGYHGERAIEERETQKTPQSRMGRGDDQTSIAIAEIETDTAYGSQDRGAHHRSGSEVDDDLSSIAGSTPGQCIDECRLVVRLAEGDGRHAIPAVTR